MGKKNVKNYADSLDISRVALQPITSPTDQLSSEIEGSYRIIRCVNVSGDDVRALVTYGYQGNLQLRMGDQNNFHPLANITPSDRGGSYVAVAVHIRKGPDILTFMCDLSDSLTKLSLKCVKEFDTIVEATVKYEFTAYPTFPKPIKVGVRAAGEVKGGLQRFVSLRAGNSDLVAGTSYADFTQTDSLLYPGPNVSDVTPLTIASGQDVHGHLTSFNGKQRSLFVSVKPKPF